MILRLLSLVFDAFRLLSVDKTESELIRTSLAVTQDRVPGSDDAAQPLGEGSQLALGLRHRHRPLRVA